ncbi:hypothetical protein [Azospirillum argentinense]
MSKNLINLSESLLGKFLDERGMPVIGKLKAPEDFPAEREYLRQMKTKEVWHTDGGARAFSFSHDGKNCIALNFSISSEFADELSNHSQGTVNVVEVPGSIFLVVADRINLQPLDVGSLHIEQFVAGPAASDEGVDLKEVKKYLEGCTIVSIEENSIFENNISERYVANYVCTFQSRYALNKVLGENSINLIRSLFFKEKTLFIEKNLFAAMETPLLPHAFLEVYRILEFVFVLPRTISLLEKVRPDYIESRVDIMDFAKSCNKLLGWKRGERDSIERLFRQYSSTNFTNFEYLCQNCALFIGVLDAFQARDKDKENFIKNCSEKYYEIRNQIVHQFWPDEVKPCSEGDWKALIEFTLGCVSHFYDGYLGKARY